MSEQARSSFPHIDQIMRHAEEDRLMRLRTAYDNAVRNMYPSKPVSQWGDKEVGAGAVQTQHRPETLIPKYLVVKDTTNMVFNQLPIDSIPSIVLYWRRFLSPYKGEIDTDTYFTLMKDHRSMEYMAMDRSVWSDHNIRGILDLRAVPIHFSVVGREYAPYYMEYDILMKICE